MAASDVQQMLEAGIAAARAGDRARARRLLAEVVRQEPGNEQGWLWLAGMVDRPAETIYCLEQALIVNPNNQAARQGIAWARRQLEEPPAPPPAPATPAPPAPQAAPSPPPPPLRRASFGEERETLAERLATDKVSLPRWEARGLASLRSLETVDEMVARGKSVLEQGRFDEAADILRGAIARQPDHAEAHAHLAVAFYHLGDKRGALVEFENAIAIDPNYVDAHLSLGQVYFELGETKAAIHCWERVLELAPGHAEARESLAKARAKPDSRHQCPNCGATLSKLDPVCSECGEVIFVRCANCGEYAERKDETCPRCGMPLSEAPKPKRETASAETRGAQIACLNCGKLNPAYHIRCAACGAALPSDKTAVAAPPSSPPRRLRFRWVLIVLLCWISACGLCAWGSTAAVQLMLMVNLRTADLVGLAGDLLGQRTNESLVLIATWGSSLLLGLVGLIGLRRMRS